MTSHWGLGLHSGGHLRETKHSVPSKADTVLARDLSGILKLQVSMLATWLDTRYLLNTHHVPGLCKVLSYSNKQDVVPILSGKDNTEIICNILPDSLRLSSKVGYIFPFPAVFCLLQVD